MSYALITGAAKGIGKAIAFELAIRNYNLILIDLDEDSLSATADTILKHYKVDVQALHIDLSEPGSTEHILRLTKPYYKDLNVLINNAGYGLNGAFENLTLEEQLNIIDVNIRAVVKISHHFIPVLKTFPKAYLLNVASTTAYQPVPYLNIYASTKAFVLSFTRALRYELRNTSVSVSALSPGSTDTDFVKRARMGPHILKTADKFNMDPKVVAKVAVNGLFKGKAEIVPGFSNKLNAQLPKFFPKKLVEKIAGNIYEPQE
jgi:uncharacterized protein